MRIFQLTESYPIDNVNGLGAVPNNQEVDYKGLRVLMHPYMFIKLAAPLGREPKPELVKLIQQKTPIGAPFLIVEIPEGWEDGNFEEPAKVKGHEGRNRIHAIKQIHGDDMVEVHIFLTNGMRARHLTPDMISHMRNSMQAEKSTKVFGGPTFFLPK